MRLALAVWVVLLSSSCGRTGRGSRHGSTEPLESPKGPLGYDEAVEYMVALVNRDRAEEGLDPVEWDETAAKAARRHAEDMARHGFTGHWGTDGSVPEERYTQAGGVHMVQENAACFGDGVERDLDGSLSFSAANLEKLQATFMAETPPNDGHKQNILKPKHNRLGVGLVKVVGIDHACLAQEFVDEYGDYDGLPQKARIGQKVEIAGEVNEPAEFGGVGIARIDPAKPLSVDELKRRSTYPIPEPYVLYFPEGFKTPKPVTVKGDNFSIEVPLSQAGKPGRYQVSVWGSFPPDKTLSMLSLRVIEVK
jgi:uncharacterized protein YkwD